MVNVPNVKHESVSQAQSTLKAAGFQVNLQTDNNSTGQPNTVVKQDPTGWTKAKFGSIVTIFTPPSGNIVPNVIGDNIEVALAKLGNAGFTNIGNPIHVANPAVPNGTVQGQSVHSGQRVPANTLITLTVVKNAPTPSPTPTTASPTPSATPSPTGTGP
jgi:beta-lactam-binding protein with PASTA domain